MDFFRRLALPFLRWKDEKSFFYGSVIGISLLSSLESSIN